MRNLIATMIFFVATTSFASVSQLAVLENDNALKIDPIVTGQSVTEEQRARWLAARKRAEDCADCAVSQAYPED